MPRAWRVLGAELLMHSYTRVLRAFSMLQSGTLVMLSREKPIFCAFCLPHCSLIKWSSAAIQMKSRLVLKAGVFIFSAAIEKHH